MIFIANLKSGPTYQPFACEIALLVGVALMNGKLLIYHCVSAFVVQLKVG